MIRIMFLLITFLINSSLSFAQKDKEIEVSFIKVYRQIDNVQYYVVKGNDAFLLEKKDGKIKLDNKHINENNEELKFLVKSGNSKLEFFIEPENIYHLKISKMSFSFKYFFKRMYIINQGLDYEEIVRQSKKKYNYKV